MCRLGPIILILCIYIFFLFSGDKWGEVDTRFSFCAVLALSLIQRLSAIDLEKAIDFVLSCMNFDGGFGSRPGSESHAGRYLNNN